jgi:peptidoglycan/LPS O-acetylase OafA/YrhL
LWRKFGALTAVLVGFAVGCLPLVFASETAYAANTWYLGLFALGMGAAGINFASRSSEQAVRARAPLGLVTLGLLAACAVGTTALIKLWFRVLPLSDALVGLTTAAALCYLTRRALDTSAASRPVALRVLETPALVGLGRFSYSLYLTHLPIVALCYLALERLGLSAAVRSIALIALSLPLSLAVAFAFFWVFERRFVGDPRAFFGRKAAGAD